MNKKDRTEMVVKYLLLCIVTTPNAEAVGLYGLLGKNTGDIS